MIYSYSEALNNIMTNDLRRIKFQDISDLKETIISRREERNGEFTDEQEFLITYYNLDRNKINGINFDLSNFQNYIEDKETISEDEKQARRYRELVDLEFIIQPFDKERINKERDRFHKKIASWDDYTNDIDQNPLMIKKMRNLQIINRIAHEYIANFRTIIYHDIESINNYELPEKKTILFSAEKLFSKDKKEQVEALNVLKKFLKIEEIQKIYEDSALKYCNEGKKWMFNEKTLYINEILSDLQKENDGYNYGIIKDKDGKEALAFDVPEYGQFSVHPSEGKDNSKTIQQLRKQYGIGDYNGEHLGNVFILAKADKKLLKKANKLGIDNLSKEERQLYDILTQKPPERDDLYLKIQEEIEELRKNIEELDAQVLEAENQTKVCKEKEEEIKAMRDRTKKALDNMKEILDDTKNY